MLPLDGIRILDLSWQGPGPFCTMLLGDLGADVIKVEDPGISGRRTALKSTGSGYPEIDLLNEALGRNKRSITLNLKSEAARDIFYELVKTADVVVEGYRPGVTGRLGVDYARLKEINPGIVYCSISGYGQSGPYRNLAGHDLNYSGIGGALGMIGQRGGPPAIPINLVADFGGGSMHAVMGILTSLFFRQKTGVGQYIDVSLTDSVLSLMTGIAYTYLASGAAPGPGESMFCGAYPHYSVYQTKDGKYLTVGSLEPWLFAELCRALGREDFIGHETNPEKHDEIFASFRETFKTKTRDEWVEHLRGFDSCTGPVYGLDEVFQDPQVLARDMLVDLEHPTQGKSKHVGVAVKLSETPGAIRSPAPSRGQHTDEILSSLGYAESDIRGLREQGAI